MNILIVDDHPTNLLLLKDLLASRGYAVTAVDNGQDALQEVARARPDLLLLDIQMPGLSGTEVLRVLRQAPETRDLKVIALTALAMSGDRESILASGFDDYISKPFKFAELFATIARHLGSETSV
ncbi:CheY-like chemotaxis protein [Deinobacterium chartae]|uniref:CheY-like chemotaxis protein n=1 Tax=Deinobacterium chartae TaxID=521158 RepID=A0A841I0G5_9DEIO|nr:response regulator [Deinobacterium chartae]MBB6097748.1 CheY-like chemotaxis protein [Deinobacterium chartae]